jgi:hemerythrin-like domain-containing protein
MLQFIKLLNQVQHLFADGKIDREEAHLVIDYIYDKIEEKKK